MTESSQGFTKQEVFQMHAAMAQRALQMITDGQRLQALALKFLDEFLPEGDK